MKHIFIALFSLFCLTTTAQEFNRWAVEGDFGITSIGDESAEMRDNYNHFGLGIRYNINPKFGLGLNYGKDNLALIDFDGNNVNTDYNRYNLEAFVDVFDILDLQNNFITFLAHGGGGLSTIDAIETDYYQSVFNMRGGLTALIKLSRSIALKADVSTTVNISQDKTLDGAYDISNAGINSTVDNMSAGLVFYLGKKGKKLEHADWYVAPPVAPVVKVVEVTPVTNTYVTQELTSKCDCQVREFVFFDHDKYEVKGSELNAIQKIYDRMSKDKDSKLFIDAYASATQSSNEYNWKLSLNRGEEVKSELVKMGVDASRIEVRANGKDFNWKDEAIHKFARRVELIIQ